MHAYLNTEFCNSSNVSSNRIKIQVILLILQSETDYSSKLFIRSSGITVFTETSRTAILHEEVLQDSSDFNSSSNSTCAHYTTVHPENSPSRIQFYMQKTKSSSSTTTTTEGKETFIPERNSTHRRQGDLQKSIHVFYRTFQAFSRKTFQRHPVITDIPVFPDIPDIPVFQVFPDIPDTPETFRTFQSFMTFQPFQAILQCSSISRQSTPFQHSPIRMHILQFLQFDWFPQKTPPSTS